MKASWSFTRGFVLGAGLMYLMDPSQGGRRRARVRDQGARAWRRSSHFMGRAGRDLRNRTQGRVAEAITRFRRVDASDWVIEERVRSKLGRLVAHPHAVQVEAIGGHVTLSGPILRHETGPLISAVQSIPAVADVENRLEEHEAGENIPALLGRGPRRGELSGWAPDNWPPSLQFLAGAAGAVAVAYGARRAIAKRRAARAEGERIAPNYAYLR